MKTREEYDKIVNDLKEKLGDNFANVSDIIADLSTDYDSVIQADLSTKQTIQQLNNEKVQLLETNNKLFTQITNSKEPTKDPIIKKTEDDIKGQDKPLDINNIINEKGELE